MYEADLELLILSSLCFLCGDYWHVPPDLVYMVLRLNPGFHTGKATILPSELYTRPHLDGFILLFALGHFYAHMYIMILVMFTAITLFPPLHSPIENLHLPTSLLLHSCL